MSFRVPGRWVWVALAVATPLAVLVIMASWDVANLITSPVAAMTNEASSFLDDVETSRLYVQPVAAMTNEASSFAGLRGAKGITTTEISGGTYALVTARQAGSVQIINITDPAVPVPVAVLTTGINGFGEMPTQTCEALRGCHMLAAETNGSDGTSRCSCHLYNVGDGVTTTEISGRTYALVTTLSYDGVQIIDITDPASPVPMVWRTDDYDGFTHLGEPRNIAIAEISGRTYALVTALNDKGVQIIDITNPLSPVPVIGLAAGINGFTDLGFVAYVATTEISGRTYALVTAPAYDHMHIINITDPASPVPITVLTTDTDGFTHIPTFSDIAIAEISGRTYALITTGGSSPDGGVQIIDITDPTSPVPVAWLTGGTYGFAKWHESLDITIAEMSGRTYVLITAHEFVAPYMPLIGPDGSPVNSPRDHDPDHGVQIIDITDPTSPVPVAWLTDEVDGFTHLDVPWNIAIAEISGSTYALITTNDLRGSVQIAEMVHP